MPEIERNTGRGAATYEDDDIYISWLLGFEKTTYELDDLFPVVHEDLIRIARASAPASMLLDAEELVNEAYMALSQDRVRVASTRPELFAQVATAMRRVLARERRSSLRNSRELEISIEDSGVDLGSANSVTDFGASSVGRSADPAIALAVKQALAALGKVDPDSRAILRLRNEYGLSVSETAVELGCSESAIRQGWNDGTAFLRAYLEGPLGDVATLALETESLEPETADPNELPQVYTLDCIDPSVLRLLDQHPELLKTLDWRLFELLLADILERIGFEIELTRGSKDGGVDIFAVKPCNIFDSHRYLIPRNQVSIDYLCLRTNE